MKSKILSAITVTLALPLLISCGKDVQRVVDFEANEDPLFDNDPSSRCRIGKPVVWNWQQPESHGNGSVDLLFVTDTSLSQSGERRRLAKALPQFLKKLPSGSDARLAVLPAHASKKWAGRLFARGDRENPVINVADVGAENAAKILEERLSCIPKDKSLGNGEMGLYSLQTAMADRNFQASRAQGFFRTGAALSVVFVSDENDACYDPKANGYTTFPDYNFWGSWLERLARKKYCTVDGEAVGPSSVVSSLRARMPNTKISLAGIVHTVGDGLVAILEDSIGHGIIETVHQVEDGLLMDMRSGDFEAGLGQLAERGIAQVDLMTSFPLDTGHAIDPESIQVLVDGQEVDSSYDEESGVVEISEEDAGWALSKIEVSACRIQDPQRAR